MARSAAQVVFFLSCLKRLHEVSEHPQPLHKHSTATVFLSNTKSRVWRGDVCWWVWWLVCFTVSSAVWWLDHWLEVASTLLCEGIQIHPSQADSSAGSLALSKLRVILFFCGVPNSALHLTCTGCSRWNLLKMLTLSIGNLSESFLF